jgi:hypothetical protein
MIPIQSLLADALAEDFLVESAGRDLSRSVQVYFSGLLLDQSLNKQAGKVQGKGGVHFFSSRPPPHSELQRITHQGRSLQDQTFYGKRKASLVLSSFDLKNRILNRIEGPNAGGHPPTEGLSFLNAVKF